MSDTLDVVLQRYEAAATKFIACVDSPTLESDVFLANVGRCLADLYCCALDVPPVKSESEFPDDTPFPMEQWTALYHSLREKIGDKDVYWEVFDSQQKEQPIQATLSNDISDIYFDLKKNLQLKNKGMSGADLIWEIYFSFREHWARHALHALNAINDLRVDDREWLGTDDE